MPTSINSLLLRAPWSGCLMACDLDVAGLLDRDYALEA
jgi:hypothetical protein